MSSTATADFSVVTELSAHERRVRPSGEIDIGTMERVADAMIAAEGSDASRVCLDFRGVTFMDSSGVHLAIEAQERLKHSGRELRLVRGSRRVQRVFQLTGTESLLPFD